MRCWPSVSSRSRAAGKTVMCSLMLISEPAGCDVAAAVVVAGAVAGDAGEVAGAGDSDDGAATGTGAWRSQPTINKAVVAAATDSRANTNLIFITTLRPVPPVQTRPGREVYH